MRKIYILGGGPAGLGLADGLGDDGRFGFHVIDENENLGGLAQTLQWDLHGSHDLGPHKIFTIDTDLLARVKSLLPESDWLHRPKKSSIFLHGHYLPYPPSPFSLINVFGPVAFAKMVADYGLARAFSMVRASNARSFKDDLHQRVGKELYQHLFEPIASKLWGDPAELDAKLSQGRVQTPSLSEVVGRLLKLRKQSQFEALEFIYPRGGLKNIWAAIRNKTEGTGQYHLGHRVVELEVKDGYVSRIVCQKRNSEETSEFLVRKNDFVFSSLPLKVLSRLLSSTVGEQTVRQIDEVVQLNDLLLVFLKVDRPSLLDESWVFVPDPNIIFHRISEQESFDPEMARGGSIVCCEVMSHRGRPMIDLSDEKLIDEVKLSLDRMGYRGFQITGQKVIRLRSSYPVYRPGYEPKLVEILSRFDALGNFKSIGRQGSFNYIGTLDAMDIGYGAARWLCQTHAEKNGSSEWKIERERTSHYAVLD